MDLTNEFLKFVYFSLTDGQQDITHVKYHIAVNKDKSVKELQEEIIKEFKFYRSDARIRKIKKYEIPLIIKKLKCEQNIS